MSAGDIAGFTFGGLVLVLPFLALTFMLILRRRRARLADDRHLELYTQHKEGASLAYVPELDIPTLPFDASSTSSTSSKSVEQNIQQSQLDRQLWQLSSQMYRPDVRTPFTVPMEQTESDELLSGPDLESLLSAFDKRPKLQWRAASLLQPTSSGDGSVHLVRDVLIEGTDFGLSKPRLTITSL